MADLYFKAIILPSVYFRLCNIIKMTFLINLTYNEFIRLILPIDANGVAGALYALQTPVF
jgi:hypothetical protein